MPWQNGSSRTSTPQHRRWRATVMRRDNNQCQVRDPGCQGIAAHADHITPVGEGGAEYDLTNGQAICIPCHKTKTQAEAIRGQQRRSRARPTRTHPGLIQRVGGGGQVAP